MTPIPWNPVGKFGCGDPEGCPQCSPMVQLEREKEHLRRVASTYPRYTPADQVQEWIAEAYGTGGERSLVVKATAAARGLRSEGRARVLVKRTLTTEDRAWVSDHLNEIRPTKVFLTPSLVKGGPATNEEWLSEVWLEILNPSVLVARRERSMDIREKVARAINRAQGNMRQERLGLERDRAAVGVGT